MHLRDFKVLSFDCYGTLIDWETGLLEALRPLAARIKVPLDEEGLLAAFAQLEAAQEDATPTKHYREILAIVFKRLAERFEVAVSRDECLAFGLSVEAWPAFPDSAAALAALKRHYKLVVLSNVDTQSFAASNRTLGVAFDAVYTAEETGAYKPRRAGFDYMIDRLAERGFAKGDILHVAQSLFHDHGPAAELGLARCWIDRRHGRHGAGATPAASALPEPDFRFKSLADFVRAHADAIA